MRTIKLKQIGYQVTGTAYIKLWGGGEGGIQMDITDIKGKLTKKKLLSCINDGQFGCQEILCADIDVFDLFENQYTEFNRTIHALKQTCKNAQKGI